MSINLAYKLPEIECKNNYLINIIFQITEFDDLTSSVTKSDSSGRIVHLNAAHKANGIKIT